MHVVWISLCLTQHFLSNLCLVSNICQLVFDTNTTLTHVITISFLQIITGVDVSEYCPVYVC
jgi:hypothetical protein